MKQLIIKDRYIGSNKPVVVVLLPPAFCVKASYQSEDKSLRLALYDDKDDDWHDNLIYKPFIAISDEKIALLEAIKSDSEKMRLLCRTIEELFIYDVAIFVSEGLLPDTSYADKAYLDFAFIEDHVNQVLDELFTQMLPPKPKK